VWITSHTDETGNKIFYDFVNVNFDSSADFFSAASGVTATFTLPYSLINKQITAQFYDADGTTGKNIHTLSLHSTRVAISIPTFRVYGTLVLTGVPRPVVIGAGPGCDDGYCIWVTGMNFDPDCSIDLRRLSDSAIVGQYAGTLLNRGTTDDGTQVLTL